MGELPHYHWHIEVIPRLTKVAGFEWGSGFYINPVPPENAASFFRESRGRRSGAARPSGERSHQPETRRPFGRSRCTARIRDVLVPSRLSSSKGRKCRRSA